MNKASYLGQMNLPKLL